MKHDREAEYFILSLRFFSLYSEAEYALEEDVRKVGYRNSAVYKKVQEAFHDWVFRDGLSKLHLAVAPGDAPKQW